MNKMFGLGADPNAGVPDASTTVKGIVRLATEEEAVEPNNALNNIALTPANMALFLMSGWVQAFEPWVYVSADAPTFVMKIPEELASVSVMRVGCKLWIFQGAHKYFIVTGFDETPVGGYHLVTVYGGTDYVLTSAAITSAFFSHDRSPLAFPMDPSKWTVSVTDTTQRTQATPTQNTWYNLGTISINIPIGAWRVSYRCFAQVVSNAAQVAATCFITLSTANNSESDPEMTGGTQVGGASATIISGVSIFVEKMLVLAAKTTYYLNSRTTLANMASIHNRNDLAKLSINLVCAYL